MNETKPTVGDLIKVLQKLDKNLELWGMNDEDGDAYQRTMLGTQTRVGRYHNEIRQRDMWDEVDNIYEEDGILETKDVYMIF